MFNFVCSKEKPLIIPIFIPHLGCPNLCAFCNQKTVTGVTAPSIDIMEKTVKEYLEWSKKRKRTEISFYGGSFTALPKETMMNFIKKGMEFVKNGAVDVLRCSTRPDGINEKIVEILKENSFDTVELGVQTMSDCLLNKMKRGHNADNVFESLQILKKAGIKTGLQFMTGYPFETETDIEITKNSLKILKPDFIRIYPFVPLEQTEIYNEIQNGFVKLNSVNKTIERTAELFLEAMLQSIPVIRIGLPVSNEMPDIYPHNLFQIVVSKAIQIVASRGETDFCLPESWMTSFNIAKKDCPEISAKFI